MKCTASNRKFVRQRRHDHGMKRAVELVSLYLDYVLSDKNRYKNVRIKQIHASIDRTVEQIEKGETSIEELNNILKEQHNAHIDLGENNRIRPHGLYSDFANGVYATMDQVNIILIYVLVHLYGMGEEKVNNIISGITNVAACCNQGYLTENDIRRALRDEEGLEVRNIKEVTTNGGNNSRKYQ